MKFRLWKEFGARNAEPVFDAFRHSILSAGYNICDSNDIHASDCHVIWSVLFNGRMAPNKNIWENARRANRPVIVLEVGGIDRGTTWKVAINGINRAANFGDTTEDQTRAKKLGLELKPWKEQGEYVLICGQHDKSLQWENMPRMSHWVMDTIETIQKHTDMPIVFRPHPRCRLEHIERQYKNVYRDEPRHLVGTYDDYNLSFSKVHAIISYSSNPGPQGIINGVPAFVSKDSLAYDVGNDIELLEHINNPAKPNRKQWLNYYAWTEYTLDEISDGIPLKRLTNCF
tara:strand:+ start:1446 stop:2303 length:858 start_codon:yes stop_codon:yes gene_type:complete